MPYPHTHGKAWMFRPSHRRESPQTNKMKLLKALSKIKIDPVLVSYVSLLLITLVLFIHSLPKP